MSGTSVRYRAGAVRPIECIKSGWHMIKDQYWMFLAITLVGVILGSLVPLGIIMGPMMCGIYMCLLYKMRGGRASFDLLFRGFDLFTQSLIATLIIILPTLAIMLPVNFIFAGRLVRMAATMPRQPSPEYMARFFQEYFSVLAVVMGVLFIISILVGMFFIFTYPLIVDRGLSGVDAIKTSISAALENLGGILGLLLINMLFGILGMSCCYVGAIFLMPINFAAFTIAYHQVFGEQV